MNISFNVNNNQDNENLSKADKVVDTLVESYALFVILRVCALLIPLFTFIVTAFLVGNKIISLNSAITILRALFIGLTIFNISIYVVHKVKKNNEHHFIDNFILILGLAYIAVLIYTTFFMPVKLFNYANKDYVTIDGIQIPTVYKYSKYDNAFLSLQMKEQADVTDENGKTINCKSNFISIAYINEKKVPQEYLDTYEIELKEQGFLKYEDEETSEEITVYYKYCESENYLVYCGFNQTSLTYGKITADEKLPAIDKIMQTKK